MSRDQKPGRLGVVGNGASSPKRSPSDSDSKGKGPASGNAANARIAAGKVAATSAMSALPAATAETPRRPVLMLSIAFLLACAGGGMLVTFLASNNGIGG